MGIGQRQYGLKRAVTAFAGDRRGNVAMIWGLTAVVLLGLMGLAVDFTRAQTVRTRLQNAVDGAALVAARASNMTEPQRLTAARAYFDAEMGDEATEATFTLAQIGDDEYRVDATLPFPVTLARIVRNEDWQLRVNSQAVQGGIDLEVSLILDATGSMAGQRIADLRTAAIDFVDIVVQDDQDPFYSKVALVPYSMAVNAGSTYANAVRGSITPGRSITAASWASTMPARTITGATRANPVVITSAAHGLQNGDGVYITGVNGMTQINNRRFVVAGRTTNTFQLQGVNGSGYNNYTSGGTARQCQTSQCEIVVTANNHGFANNDHAFITGVNGMTQINNAANATWQVAAVTTNTFALTGSNGPSYSNYTSGGTAFCTVLRCEYFRFNNQNNGAQRVHRVSTCVTERTGPSAYTNAAPNSSPLMPNYPSTGNPCAGGNVFQPLTNDTTVLNNRINALQAAGSTGGHLGAAWGWYMLEPSFRYLFPTDNQAADYDPEQTMKVAVLMTDGEYNSSYCNGVISGPTSTSGSGSTSDQINCAAPNGHSFDQAVRFCEEMKDAGITVYTVGFDVVDDQRARDLVNNCATSAAHVKLAANGVELRAAFREIAQSISQLRLSM